MLALGGERWCTAAGLQGVQHGVDFTAVDYDVAGTRVVCNPRGYPGEKTGFRSDLIIEL